MFFESLFEGSFRFADVTGFTVVACQLIHYTAFVLGLVTKDAPDGESQYSSSVFASSLHPLPPSILDHI